MDDAEQRTGYPRSTGSPRGQARRRELLERVTDDLAANGLVDFSLRRAARAAGTTHKVLLYHFAGPEALLTEAVSALRDRRIRTGLAAAAAGPGEPSLADRMLALWPAVSTVDARVLEQAMGLAMYDPDRYAELGRGAAERYLPSLLSLCPPHWGEQRKREVAEMVLAALRGFVVDVRTNDGDRVTAGLAALRRALDREEAAAE